MIRCLWINRNEIFKKRRYVLSMNVGVSINGIITCDRFDWEKMMQFMEKVFDAFFWVGMSCNFHTKWCPHFTLYAKDFCKVNGTFKCLKLSCLIRFVCGLLWFKVYAFPWPKLFIFCFFMCNECSPFVSKNKK